MLSFRRGTDRTSTRMFSRSSRPTTRTKHRRFLRVEPLEERVVLSTYWVSPSGNDSNAGTKASPFLTPQNAMKSLEPGDTLNIEAGTYTGFIVGWDSVPASSGDAYGTINGTAGNPITIQADPSAAPGSVIIDSRDNKTPCGIDIEPGCNYITINGLAITDGDGSISEYGIKFSGGSNFIIENMIVHNVGKTGIFSSFVTNSLVQNNVSYSNGEHGFYMSNSPQNVQVLNNVAYDNATAGLEVNADASQGGPGTAQNITIANNTAYDNNSTNHSGAMNLDGVQNSLIYNNLLYGNNATGLVLYDGDASQGCIDNTIVNNTIVMPSNGTSDQYALDNNTNSYGNKFYNNIMLGEMLVDSGSTPGAWSNNILWTGYTNDGAYAFPAGIESTPAALFQAPSTGNYQELSTSPSIGAGTSTDAPSTDILGNPRPSSKGYDIGCYECETSTPSAPSVTGETPASGATNVAVLTAPTATFNEAVQAGTISFTLENSSGSSVAATVTYNSSNNMATLTPSAALAYSTTYTATVSGATDSAGDPMTSPVSWSFTTAAAASAVAPTVTSETPASGATSVAMSMVPTATFNEAVQASTISFTLKSSSGSSMAGSVSCNSTTNVTTFTPTSALASNTTYTATISGAESTSGVAMTAPFSWSFTTTASAPSTGLVAAYSFNEGSGSTVYDSSGNGNNGTISNATWSTAGKYGDALSFNGSNALVSVNDSTSLHLTTGMTLEAWVNPTTVSSDWRDVIYKGNDNYFLEATCTQGSLPAAGATVGTSDVYAAGTSVLAMNTWTYLTETYDGTALRLYVNGVQVSSLAETGNILTSTNALQIGGDSIFGQYFSGLIDDVRVYNQALTQSQIQSDMNTPVAEVAPTVRSESPASGATNVAVSTTVTATFNEVVQASKISFTLKNSKGSSVPASVSYNSSTNTATLTPSAALAFNTTYYTATVSGAQNNSGVAMSSPFTWSFTTDVAPPTVTSESPASGATGVAVSTKVTATFNEAVQASTISITLKNSSGSKVAAKVTYNSTTNTATLTPSAALAYSTTYTATVSGAKDSAGDPMSAPFSWSFTTGKNSKTATASATAANESVSLVNAAQIPNQPSSQTVQTSPSPVTVNNGGALLAASGNGDPSASSAALQSSAESDVQDAAVASLVSGSQIGILPESLVNALAQDRLRS